VSPHPAAKRVEQVGRGVSATLTCPGDEQLDGLGERVGEEAPRVVGDARAELELPCDRHDPWEQRLEQAAPNERVACASEKFGNELGSLQLVEATARFERRHDPVEIEDPCWQQHRWVRVESIDAPTRLLAAPDPAPLVAKLSKDVGVGVCWHLPSVRGIRPRIAPCTEARGSVRR
jgi:hypothetical protein